MLGDTFYRRLTLFTIAAVVIVLAESMFFGDQDEPGAFPNSETASPAGLNLGPKVELPTAEPTLDLTWHSVNPSAPNWTPTPLPTATPEPTRPAPFVYEQPRPAGECPAIILEVFGDTYAPAACRVAFCESRYNPNATGAQGEMGYFQIHPRWHADATYDPLGNTLAAFRISTGGTQWHAWSCKP